MKQAVDVAAPISAEAAVYAGDILGEAWEVRRRPEAGLVALIDPLDMARILRTAMERVRQLPVTVCVTGAAPDDAGAPGAAELVDFLRWDILSRGHRLTVLLGRGPSGGLPGGESLRTLREGGARVRVAAEAPPAVLTLGEELAVLRPVGGAAPAGPLLVRGGALVGVLHRLQLALWERGVEYDRAPHPAVAGPVLDETQARVLGKLCAGMKDEAAARQMNVSVRTYRRHVAGILKVLDVSSRFEAGLKVAELGLLAGHRAGRG